MCEVEQAPQSAWDVTFSPNGRMEKVNEKGGETSVRFRLLLLFDDSFPRIMVNWDNLLIPF